mmetsp:Transcript_51408/g.51803  ORF Transcript_51408/g.51803 Transcript_51408/m.51803 type:complete len:103 (-) Transcript_51408:264-572(-)
MLHLAECNCDTSSILENLSAEGKDYYSHNAWAIVGDMHYKIRNLITQYFAHHANQVQPNGFGAYEFFTYELEHPRPPGSDGFGPNFPSDGEKYGLAGFEGVA